MNSLLIWPSEEKNTEKGKDKDKEKGKDKDKEKDKDNDKEKGKDKDTERDKDKERDEVIDQIILSAPTNWIATNRNQGWNILTHINVAAP